MSYEPTFITDPQSFPGICRLIRAARAWHDFHDHEPRMIQCDAICDALPAAEAELAKMSKLPEGGER